MEQKAKRVGKFNVIDIIAVILILAVAAFGAWKLLGSGDGGEAGESSMVQVTYVVRAEGVPVELYENCLEHLPSPLMASVMLGGMVPPLAIALATLLFRSRFTVRQRQTGMMNFVMGLSFITEGAIPFAAEYPSRVIPACAIGAAVAGALSMVFGCTIPAPHGGIFVLGVVHNWPMYLLSLAAGTAVGAVLLGFLKKDR